MGSEVKTTNTTQQATATPEERELNRLTLDRVRAAQPGLLQTQESALNLSNLLLTGQGLPGFLGGLPGGISPEDIGTEAARVASETQPNLQALGLADSGTGLNETARRVAERVLFPARQFNLQNLSQLLNLAVGGQAQVQGPILQQQGLLGQQLAGLRTTTGSGTTTTRTNFFSNPFVVGIGQGFGQGVGAAAGGGLFRPTSVTS